LYVFGAVAAVILNATVPDEADALPRPQRAVAMMIAPKWTNRTSPSSEVIRP
jgi:hypothetical protein